MAVGLGVFFVVAVRSLQLSLREEFAIDMNALRADMYLIEIQPGQRGGVGEIVAKYAGSKPQLVPTVSARLAGISNTQANIDNIKPNESRGLMGREYITTYRSHIEDFEKVLEGEFWDSPLSQDAEPEVSIEELLHKELGLNVGDTMTFNVQGRHVTARVANVRRVDWRNARTGFLVVFRPGPLDRAPAKYIAAIKGPADSGARARLQRDLIDKYPNVSVVDVRDVIELARGIVQNISLAVSFVGGFVFLSGLLILIGSIAMTKFHRLYESAILKTLGAKKKLIAATLLVEYGVLGVLAGALGSSAAIALTWAVSKHALKIEWHFIPSVNLLGGFVFLSGLLILIGSIAMTKFHRLYESAILKTLGAKKKLIATTLLVEYGVLGVLAGALGSSAAIALTWAVSKHALKIDWHFIPSVNLLGVVVAAALVMAVGALSSWDVMVKKPLGILRAE
jgi:putative ABC transport system permease protein